MFENMAENLINYTFNAIAYETNEIMRRLTLVTITFLPLTFLTGYFVRICLSIIKLKD
jgi:Mg2+ and Co2+ transporter CorA